MKARYLKLTILICLMTLLPSGKLLANGQKVTKRDVTGDMYRHRGLAVIDTVAARAHIGFLAGDALQGREAGCPGARIAAEYIVSRLREVSVAPLYDGYLQPFSAYSEERQKRKRYHVSLDSIARISRGVHRRLDLANVLGVIPGTNSDEYVVIGAHYDHLGCDNTLAGDKIYNGADDNASGVSAVLQIAKAFKACGVKPKRSVIFAFWDGEEIGLLGSKYFMQTVGDSLRIRGYINFDMIGRNHKPGEPTHVVYFYTASHPQYGQWLKEDINTYGLHLTPDYRAWNKPTAGSDNAPFAAAGIPIIWYHTDGHPDYHQPGDHSSKINYQKVTDITRSAFLNLLRLATD